MLKSMGLRKHCMQTRGKTIEVCCRSRSPLLGYKTDKDEFEDCNDAAEVVDVIFTIQGNKKHNQEIVLATQCEKI